MINVEKINFQQLVEDLRSHELSNIEIAENSGCSVGVVSRMRTGSTKEPRYTVGVKLIVYHKKICEQAFMKQEKINKIIEVGGHLSWAEKMTDIRRTGLSDKKAGLIVGYSESYYCSVRKAEFKEDGNIRIPLGKKAKRIDALYQERKNMPDKAITHDWRRERKVKIDEIQVIKGWQI